MAEGEHLPPVVTELKGEIADLISKLGEAKAALKAFHEETGRESEKAAKETGGRTGKALVDEFKRQLGSSLTTPGELGQMNKDLRAEFAKVGKDGATDLFREFSKTLAMSGSDNGDRVGQALSGGLVKAFEDAMGGRGQGGGGILGWFKNAGSTFSQLGSGMGQQFSGGFTGALKGIFGNPITGGIGAAIAVSIVAELGAALAGAGGVTLGLVGIGAGIAGQIKSPVVHDALSSLGEDAKAALGIATESFTQPLGDAISQLDSFISGMAPEFANVFAPLAQFIGPLEKGVEGFVSSVLPGLEAGMRQAGPLVGLLAQELPNVGAALGEFFNRLTASVGGDKAGLQFLLDIIDQLIIGTGMLLQGFSHAFVGILDVVQPVAVAVDDTLGAMERFLHIPLGNEIHRARLEVDKLHDTAHDTGQAAGDAADQVNQLNDGLAYDATLAAQATTALNDYSNALDKALGITLNQDQANLKVQQDLTALTESIKNNGDAWDTTKAAGQANMQMLQQYLGDAEKARLANIAGGQSAVDATMDYNAEVDKVLALAGAAGLTTAQLNAMKGRYEIDVEEVWKTFFINEGTPPPDFWHGLAQGGFVAPGGIIHAAQGLLPARSPGTLVLAGEPETGGEVMIPQRGISPGRAAALGSVAMAPYGLGVGPLGGGGGTAVVEHHTHVYLGGQEIAHTVDMIYPGMMAKAGQRRKGFGNSGLGAPFNPAYPTGNTFGST